MSEYNKPNKPPMKEIKAIESIKDPKEWKQDTTGYFLIDPVIDKGIIYAHFYTTDKNYVCSYSGTDAESIYYTILRDGRISNIMHAAYIGSELQKAETCIKLKLKNYIQDKPLPKE